MRAAAETTYRTDLSDVRLHSDAAAAQRAEREDARAFTLGKDVFFGGGELAPGTREGDFLIAHELAHVAQGSAAGAQAKSERSEPGQPAETEADRAANKVVANLHDNEVGAVQLTEPPSATKMRKKKNAGRKKGKLDGYSGPLPGRSVDPVAVLEPERLRGGARLLEVMLLARSGASGVEKALGLAKAVTTLAHRLAARLNANEIPEDSVEIKNDDTTWTLSGSVSVRNMTVIDRDLVRAKHSATTGLADTGSRTHEEGLREGAALTRGASLGYKAGSGVEGGVTDSVGLSKERSVTDSDTDTTSSTGAVGVEFETRDCAVTYEADLCCDLTLEYKEKDWKYDDHDVESIKLPCGSGRFTFAEPV